jgi:hypothetical protein
VAEARKIVPDYEAKPGAERGAVQNISALSVSTLAKPGDFIISRKNAPLMGLCLGFLRAGVPACVAGRDVGASLRTLIDKSRAKTVPELTAWLERWREREAKRIAKLKRAGGAIAVVLDKIACIGALAEGAEDVAEVRAKIKRLFSDKDDAAKIVCTTVHKAKGLERDRAFVLVDTFRLDRGGEEPNLYYVAVTRAKSSLFLVQGAAAC